MTLSSILELPSALTWNAVKAQPSVTAGKPFWSLLVSQEIYSCYYNVSGSFKVTNKPDAAKI
jgi:hypothetical protein